MKVLITGGTGLVGSAVKKSFEFSGHEVSAPNSKTLDLLDRNAVLDYFESFSFDLVVHCAARVGGVLGNKMYPALFISENLQMQTNLFDAAALSKVENLIFVASSCVYPPSSPLPLKEENILTGKFEKTNRWYATAKIAGIMQVEAIRLQYGLNWLSILPTNIYGPNDNFALKTGHVVPSLIRKFAQAKIDNLTEVEIWGTGKPIREFIYVSDLADAVLLIASKPNFLLPEPFIMNLGSGEEVSIKELANIIADVCGFEGKILFNKEYPDGVYRKSLDSEIIFSLGWKPKVQLRDGLKNTFSWVMDNIASLRSLDVENVDSKVRMPANE